MTFLMSLPVVLSNTMGWKDLGVLYNSLLGLDMTTNIAVLNWKGHSLYVIQVLAIQTIFSKYLLSAIKSLRYL